MRFFRQIFLAVALLFAPAALAGCASLAGGTGQQELALVDEKALITAELAFDGAVSTIIATDRAGLLTPERAAQVRPALNEARAAILRARAAYDANLEAEAAIATGDAVRAVSILAGLLVDLGLIERG